MPNRIKNLQLQIPNGYKFRLPAANWKSHGQPSFDRLVDNALRVILSNPALAAQHNWPTDRAGVAAMVEDYNVRLCEAHGWTNYITNDSPSSYAPKILPPRSPAALFARLAAGAGTLIDWLGEGGVPVAGELAAKRAAVCAGCPVNKAGDLLSWFTKPASELIRKQLEKRKELNLTTPSDDQINICEACGCPLKLKVHVPLNDIAKRLPSESREALDPRCWILSEERMSTSG